MRRFQEDEAVGFFVLSLKAGGTGLNLTAASHVVHFDRWWNPAVENQATDRAYRIGQNKNVLVHKFVCQGTVEEKIDAMIESKRQIAQDMLEGGAGTAADRNEGRRIAQIGRARPEYCAEGEIDHVRWIWMETLCAGGGTSPEGIEKDGSTAQERAVISPVTIEGRTIVKSFWGKAWCDNLESYSDYENRLPRGRTYVRNGSVVDLQIAAGQITALVSGSEIYKVEVEILPVAQAALEVDLQ